MTLPRHAILPQPTHEIRAASTAGGGTALSTTAVRIVVPDKSQGLTLRPRNFATAVVAQIATVPYIIVLRTDDNLATITDGSAAAQDGVAGTVVDLSTLDTLANDGYLLVGSHVPFRGLAATVAAANANTAALSVDYWNGSAWADITPTDGTDSGGVTLAVTGNVTWTVPTAWAKATLREAGLAPAAAVGPHQYDPKYWVRLSVDAALDAATTLSQLLAMPRSTVYGELRAADTLDLSIVKGPGGIAGVEAKVDAGTGNLIVNARTFDSGAF